MRYRIFLKDATPVEVTGYDIRIVGAKRVSVEPSEDHTFSCDISFGHIIERVADDHDRTIYEK